MKNLEGGEARRFGFQAGEDVVERGSKLYKMSVHRAVLE